MMLPKARFFDTQAPEEWARADYTVEETEKLARVLSAAGISTGMHVFEPGCGTGRLTRLLCSQTGPEGRVVALDLSLGMIEVCSRRMAGSGTAQCVLGSFEETPLAAGHFDAVVCHNVFHHFEDKPAVLGKAAGILRPYGRFVIHHFLEFSEINNPARRMHDAVRRDMMPSPDTLRTMFSLAGMRLEYCGDSWDRGAPAGRRRQGAVQGFPVGRGAFSLFVVPASRTWGFLCNRPR
ncbi:MAG: class I SAM-dependent methyltransferase [Thermodesulfobacteriota bacterium]